MKTITLTLLASLLVSHAFAADRVQPQTPCEAQAVAKAHKEAYSFFLSDADLQMIYYIPENKEFWIQFKKRAKVTYSMFIKTGSREDYCTLTEPYFLD